MFRARTIAYAMLFGPHFTRSVIPPAGSGVCGVGAPVPDCDEDAPVSGILDEETVQLIPEQEGTLERWPKQNYHAILEHELWARYTDLAYWPPDSSFRAFEQFLDIRFALAVVETARSAIDRYTECAINWGGTYPLQGARAEWRIRLHVRSLGQPLIEL